MLQGSRPSWWERHLKTLKARYPTFELSRGLLDGKFTPCLEGIIQPLKEPEEVELILADLDRDGVVDISLDGLVLHSRECHAAHYLRQELQDLPPLDEAFLLEAYLLNPESDPLVFSRDPPITIEIYPDLPHLFQNNSAICPVFGPDESWRPAVHTLADYLDQVSIWLVKFQVWLKTRERFGKGIWIGSDMGHDLETIAWMVRAYSRERCPCGSGRRYKDCHRKSQLFELSKYRKKAM